MIAGKYNRGNKFTFQMPENAPYKSLKDFPEGSTIVLRGLYFNTKGNYGQEPVALTDNAYVNLPKHLSDDVTDMMADDEFITAVNDGKVGFKIRTYQDTKYGKGTCYSVEWVDL